MYFASCQFLETCRHILTHLEILKDPHFVTFGGESFSFHGECDLVLMTSPGFASGLWLDIHVRTTRIDNVRMSYSFISGVAVRRIGTDVLETMDDGTVIVNGDSLREYNDFFPARQKSFHQFY
jgi:hypothetical protein